MAEPEICSGLFYFFFLEKNLQVSRKLSHDDASSEKSCLVSFLPQKNCFQIFPIFTETLFSHLFQEDKKAASLKFFLFWRECEDVSQLKLGVQSWKVHNNFQHQPNGLLVIGLDMSTSLKVDLILLQYQQNRSLQLMSFSTCRHQEESCHQN